MPDLRPKDPKREGNAWGEVACVNPECFVNPSIKDWIMVSDGRGSEAYIQAAIELWNQRASGSGT